MYNRDNEESNPMLYQMKFLLRKFNTELFCTYNHERTYYHRPYNHISAYTKYQKISEILPLHSGIIVVLSNK